MQSEVLVRAALLNRRNRAKRRWYRVMVALAAVVVFVTTYALILPAITMGNTVVAEVSNETELREAVANYSTGTIKVIADFDCTNSPCIIESGKDLTLDLNGHTITNRHGWGWDLFEVRGTFTIDDGTAPTVTTTKVAAGTTSPAAYDSTTNTLTYYTAYNNEEAVKYEVQLSGRLVQTGGYNLVSVKDGATLNLVDGALCSTTSGCNAVTLANGSGTVNIYGGYVVSNEASSSDGGLLTASASSTVNIYGGVLAGGEAANGGAIALADSATLNMTGGTIAGNTSTGNNGAAIYSASANATINITGGVISDNVGGDNVSYPEGTTVNVAIGVPDNVKVVEVSTEQELYEALMAEEDEAYPGGTYIRLMGDIAVTGKLTQIITPERNNLALNKTITASTYANGNPPEGAVDGAIEQTGGKRWAKQSNQSATEEWLEVDLGAGYRLDEMKVYWENIPADFSVEYSLDGQNWKTAVATSLIDETNTATQPNDQAQEIQVTTLMLNTEGEVGVVAQYVRLNMTAAPGSGNQYYLSVQELEIHGDALSALENVALNKTISSSSEDVTVSINHSDDFAVDGAITSASRWARDFSTTAEGEEWLLIDLGDTYVLDHADIYWENAPADFSVSYSMDGTTWYTAVDEALIDETNTTTANNQDETPREISLTTEDLGGVTARYVRLDMTVGSEYGWLSIQEFEVYGRAIVEETIEEVEETVAIEYDITGTKTIDFYGHTLSSGEGSEADGEMMSVRTGGSLTFCDTAPIVETVELVARLADDGQTLLDENGDPVYGYEEALDYVDADGLNNYRAGKEATIDANGNLVYYVLKPVLVDPLTGDTTEYLYKHTVSMYGGMTAADKENKIRPLLVDGGTLTVNSGFFYGFPNSVIGTDEYQGGTGKNMTYANNGNGGTININGGVFAANQADGAGAVVAIGSTKETENKTTLNMTGGVMSGNRTNGGGGAICVYEAAVFNMTGGYVTNNATTGDGGGIKTYGGSISTLTGGYITGNAATGIGGGVGVSASTDSRTKLYMGLLDLSSGVTSGSAYISGNALVANGEEACHEGGGVAIGANALGYFYSGYITNNITTTTEHWGGGGVFVAEGGNGFLRNGLMTNNSAGGFGGGIGACSTGHLLIEGENGLASFDNDAGIFAKLQGLTGEAANQEIATHLAGGKSSKHSDTDYGYNNPVFMANGRDDVYSALSCTISGRMLGGGSADWQGSVDGRAVMFGGDEVMESTSTIGLTSYASDSAKDMAKEEATMFFNGNNSYHHAGAMLINGQLIAGTSEYIDVGILLTTGVTKTLYDENNNKVEDLSDYEFTFTIYDEKGSEVSYGVSDASGKVTFDRRLGFSEEGTYWFYLVENEISDKYPGIIKDSRVYCFKIVCVIDSIQMLDDTHYRIIYTLENTTNTGFGGNQLSKFDLWYREDGVMAPGVFPVTDGDLTVGAADENGWTYYGEANAVQEIFWHDFERLANIGGNETFRNQMVSETAVAVEKVWNDENQHTADTVEMVLQQSTNGGTTWTDVESVYLGNVDLLRDQVAIESYSAVSYYGVEKEPESAFDGNLGTKWQAANADRANNWIQANLKDVYELEQVKITWGSINAQGTGYLEVSTDGEDWGTVATGLGAKSGHTEVVTFTDAEGNPTTVKAKHIRLVNKGSSNGWYASDILEIEAYAPFNEDSWKHVWEGLPVTETDENTGDTIVYDYRVIERTITQHDSIYVADDTLSAGDMSSFILVSPDKSKQLIFKETAEGYLVDETSVLISGAVNVGGVDYEECYLVENIDESAIFRYNVTERREILYSLSQAKRLIVDENGAMKIIDIYGSNGTDFHLDENGHFYLVYHASNTNGNANLTPRYYLIYDAEAGGFTLTTDDSELEDKGVLMYKSIDCVMDTDGAVDPGLSESSYITSSSMSVSTWLDDVYIKQTSIVSGTKYIITSPDGTKVLSVQYQMGEGDKANVVVGNGNADDNVTVNHQVDAQRTEKETVIAGILHDNYYTMEQIEAMGLGVFYQKTLNGLQNRVPEGYPNELYGGDIYACLKGSEGRLWHTWNMMNSYDGVIAFDANGRLYASTTAEGAGTYYIIYGDFTEDGVDNPLFTSISATSLSSKAQAAFTAALDNYLAAVTGETADETELAALRETLCNMADMGDALDAYLALYEEYQQFLTDNADLIEGADETVLVQKTSYEESLAAAEEGLRGTDITAYTAEYTEDFLDTYGALLYGPSARSAGALYSYTITNTERQYQTYALDITKVNAENTAVLVADVTFRLLDVNGQPLRFTFDGLFYHYDENGDVLDLVTDTLGKIYADGIPGGTYTLREVNCPFGYKLVGDRTVECSTNPTLTFIIEDPYSTVDLPATGGSGTTWFYVISFLLLIGAPLLYLYDRKRQQAKRADR